MAGYRRNRSWRFLLIELVVVFVGVYGAFYLSTLQEAKRERQNRVNYYQTFLFNLDQLYADATRVKSEVDSTLTLLEEKPDIPISINRDIDFTNNMLVVRGGFESENFTTIGQEYLASLDRGSNLISSIEKRANYLEEETRRFLIYGGNEMQFRRWYRGELARLSLYLGQLQQTITEGAVPETREIIRQIEEY